MNASERELLVETDRLRESQLVRLEDWELAHLRAAMLHQVEETVNESVPQRHPFVRRGQAKPVTTATTVEMNW